MCIGSPGDALEVWLSVGVTGQTPQFILVQSERSEACMVGVFFHTEAKLLETLTKQYGEKLLPSILARHFPVATGSQPQVSCLTLPGQMLFNADRQWLWSGACISCFHLLSLFIWKS